MSPSSARATTEPVAALAAVFAVGLGLALYAGVLDDAFGTLEDDRNVATPTADAVERRLSTAGVAQPRGLGDALGAVPANYHGTATITATTGERWAAGREPPGGADTEARTLSVRVGPGAVRRGTLTVRVWR